MFTFFGDGSRVGLPSLEVPIEAYPGIPLRSDRLRARRRAKGAAITPNKVRAMRAWLKRHETDKSGEGYTPGEPGFPSPGRVARALWGGDAAVTWSNKLVEQIVRAQRG